MFFFFFRIAQGCRSVNVCLLSSILQMLIWSQVLNCFHIDLNNVVSHHSTLKRRTSMRKRSRFWLTSWKRWARRNDNDEHFFKRGSIHFVERPKVHTPLHILFIITCWPQVLSDRRWLVLCHLRLRPELSLLRDLWPSWRRLLMTWKVHWFRFFS